MMPLSQRKLTANVLMRKNLTLGTCLSTTGFDAINLLVRHTALECLEDLVISFLEQLSDSIPDPHRPSDTKKSGGKKIQESSGPQCAKVLCKGQYT